VLKSQLEAFRAYLKDGAEGLYQYELKQLKKQGITEKDLKSMTVDNLEGFQKAQKDIRKNLLPNFNPTVQIEIPKIEMPEVPSVGKFGNALSALSAETVNAAKMIETFSESLKNAIQLPINSQQMQGVTDLLVNVTQAVSNNFAQLSRTNAESSLLEKIFNMGEQQKQPLNLTANVSINEAHAWDYSHIQDLAEKVADVITPRILRAIGGDSNSY